MSEMVHTDLPGRLSGDLHDLLAEYGTLYSTGATWATAPGQKLSFQSGYYASIEEADRAAIRILREMGYTKPRWFEYWRWGETKPNERILAALP